MTGTTLSAADVAIDRLEVSAFTIPTDAPEADGTLEWDSTTVVVVEVRAGEACGLGYTYGDPAIAKLIDGKLAPLIVGRDALAVGASWADMVHSIRNLGRPGICSMAIGAVDVALWDLKARLLGLPLAMMLGAARDGVPVYGSGGFTSYSDQQLRRQLEGWIEAGIRMVKIKVGRDPHRDVERVRIARQVVGDDIEVFVDANGAHNPQQALAQAHRYADAGVTWFEEPVSSDDLAGLRFVRQHAPAGIEVAAGEYGYDLPYFYRMIAAEAVDVVQADASRCAGITGFLQVAPLCEAVSLPLSAHTAPALHLHPCCALADVRHIEYFHDHVRIEQMLFDGAVSPVDGVLCPDLSRLGLGLELKRANGLHHLVYQSGPSDGGSR
ncbi:MAG: mandelate racemase [Actinomycetota bacterium]|nr:mandelate racemase [Actinomycetota bacterium]